MGLLGGCAATSVLTFVYEQTHEGECLSAGCAAKAVLMHALEKATEGDPTPCRRLNTVERALSPRCGEYEPGSLLTKDVTASGLPRCPLTLAARDPEFWPMLPELLAKGASLQECEQPPMVALAQAQPCADFPRASAEALRALRTLAETDERAIHHDVVRLLSCPAARKAGMDSILGTWLADGKLPARGLPFGVLGAVHPSHLGSPFTRALQVRGHTARAGLGAYVGQLPSGFDLALREGDQAALDWWFDQAPELANRVPPRQGSELPWVPLTRVLTAGYLAHPERQADLVTYLMSRGADPWRPLPHDASQNVVTYARSIKSPLLSLLDPPIAAVGGRPPTAISTLTAVTPGSAAR
jgi:hypothetical protein